MPQDAEPNGQKKMGATPILLYRDHIRAAKQNTMPSDFVILAIFRDKRNQCALYIAIWGPFTRQIEGIHHPFVGLPRLKLIELNFTGK
ncbi:hypothetical protein ABH944_000930 [Caballeronia udeis]|uniref:Uncharacterized protein n=1 Tax=Caballeronia udeis TaxID=1232866 RepID=A0ABW8MFD0_9BURK